MSYQYTNFENTIPIVEKWVNKNFDSYINIGLYEENNIKYSDFEYLLSKNKRGNIHA
jgi:hypothetical protein